MGDVSLIAAFRKGRYQTSKGSIVIRVMTGRKVAKTISTGIKIEEKFWDEPKRQVTKDHPNHSIYNIKISNKINSLDNKLKIQEFHGVSMTKTIVKKISEGHDPGRDFYKFCETWLPEKCTNKETLRTYNSEVSKLKSFKKELSFGDINYEFLIKYRTYMETERLNSDNTIWKTFKFLNTMMIDALEMGGIIAKNPFDSFNRGNYINPAKLGLEIEECDLLEKLLQRPDVLIIVKKVTAYFLLMCYSGLRFEDAMCFDPEKHVTNNGRLMMITEKFGVPINIKFFNRLSNIIGFIKANPLKLSNKDFNTWLKVATALAGLKDIRVKPHDGRHTFGGILANMEVPEEQAQKLLGHRDIRSTRIYYHINNKTLDRSVDKLNSL